MASDEQNHLAKYIEEFKAKTKPRNLELRDDNKTIIKK